LVEVRALCEASLDFDEADTGHVPIGELVRSACGARALDEAAQWEVRRARRAGAPRIVLAGAPNAGKSRLFNVLTGGAALVSPLEARRVTRCADAGASRSGVRADRHRRMGQPIRAAPTTRLDCAAPRSRRARRAPTSCSGLVDSTARRSGESSRARAACPRERASSACAPSATRAASECARHGRVAECPPRPARASRSSNAAVADALGSRTPRDAAAGAVRELGERHLAALRASASRSPRRWTSSRAGAALDLVAEGLRAAHRRPGRIDGRTTPRTSSTRLFARFCLGK
jgi:hypothetical protein